MDIALIGPQKAGKDSVGAQLVEFYNYVRVAFADPLKSEVAQAITSVSRRTYSVLEINQDKDRFRPLLQWWGTELRRHEDPEYWIRMMHAFIVDIRKKTDKHIVCTDARFINEIALLRSQGFMIVELVPDPEMKRTIVGEMHISEQEWKTGHIDFSVVNRYGKLSETVRTILDIIHQTPINITNITEAQQTLASPSQS